MSNAAIPLSDLSGKTTKNNPLIHTNVHDASTTWGLGFGTLPLYKSVLAADS